MLRDDVKAYLFTRRGQFSVKEIANVLSVTNARVTRALDQLVEMGEVERFEIDGKISYALPVVEPSKRKPWRAPRINGTRGRGRSSISVEERQEFDKVLLKTIKKSKSPLAVAQMVHQIEQDEAVMSKMPVRFQQGDQNQRYDLMWAAVKRLHREGRLAASKGAGLRKKEIDVYSLNLA